MANVAFPQTEVDEAPSPSAGGRIAGPGDDRERTGRTMILSWYDQAIELRYPEILRREIDVMFGALAGGGARARACITLAAEADDRFSLTIDREPVISGLGRDEVPGALMDEVIRLLVSSMDTALALHAGAVSLNEKAILVAGPTGSGKSSLIAWMVANGFNYLSDEVVALTDGEAEIAGLPRAWS